MELTIDTLLRIAKERGASDLHIACGVQPKIRLVGELIELVEFERLTPEDTARLAASIIPPKLREPFEQDGEIDFAYSIPDVGRFRVNVFMQRGVVGMVLRLINTKIPTPESLGIPKSVVELTDRKRGLVIVTGPTGSGKSTTLASLINVINQKKRCHIITLEDPIEYLHNHNLAVVNQRELGMDTMSYGNAVRAALREDPDVILVGEMRDLDTISTAITAAETGHLVFSTLHTIGSAATIDRIIDVFPPYQQQQVRVQLGMILESVISQQLMPMSDGQHRIAGFEVMHGTVAVHNLIREGKTHQIDSVIQTGKKDGMVLMDDYLLDLYMKRKITEQTLIEYSQDPIAMQQKLF